MIRRGLARQLGATVDAEYRPSGLEFRLSMPLRGGAGPDSAILAPQPGQAVLVPT